VGHCGWVLSIATGMVSVLAVALWVIIDVAWPNVRAGARVLTPEGERMTRRARRRARKAAKVASRAASSLRERLPEPRTGESRGSAGASLGASSDGGRVIDLTEADALVEGAVRRVEAGVAARTPQPAGPSAGTRTTVPAQNASPLATSVGGASETIAG